jgi:hypothetical protein
MTMRAAVPFGAASELEATRYNRPDLPAPDLDVTHRAVIQRGPWATAERPTRRAFRSFVVFLPRRSLGNRITVEVRDISGFVFFLVMLSYRSYLRLASLLLTSEP